jgi:hypothetical protein
MLQVHKILTGKDRVSSETWFSRAGESTVSTRHAAGLMNLVKPRIRLEVRSNFFSVRTVDDWNALPENIKMLRTVWQFKMPYKKHRSIRTHQRRRQ